MQLRPNEGGFDRALRISLGIVLTATAGFLPLTGWYWLWMVLPSIGLVLLVTGISGFCPIYRAMGIKGA